MADRLDDARRSRARPSSLYAFPTTCRETGTVCAPAAVVWIGSSIAKPAVYRDRELLMTARDGTLRALTIAGVDI